VPSCLNGIAAYAHISLRNQALEGHVLKLVLALALTPSLAATCSSENVLS